MSDQVHPIRPRPSEVGKTLRGAGSIPSRPAERLVPPGMVALDDAVCVDPAEVSHITAHLHQTRVHLRGSNGAAASAFLLVDQPVHTVRRLLTA